MTDKIIFIETYKKIKELNLENPNEKRVQEVFCKFLIKNWNKIVSYLSIKYNEEVENKLFAIFNNAMNLNQNNRMLFKISIKLSEYKNTTDYISCMQDTIHY